MAQTNLFKEFVPENEPISAYLERMELFFLAHGVDADKQVAVLLSNIGSKPYGVLRSLAVPKTPKELKYADVEKILKDHYEPAPLIIAERYRFHQRGQDIGESIADYVAELRRMATKCKFEETRDFLEESLRDRFVFGLRAEGIRKRLLTEPNLTFAKAIEIAQSVETASKDAQQPFEHVSSKINSVPAPTPTKPIPVIVVVRQTTSQVTASSRKPPVSRVEIKATSRGSVELVSHHREGKGSNSVSRQGRKEQHGLILNKREVVLQITVLTFSQLVRTQQVLLW